MIVVLMGVSGSGKTTIGTLLAQETGVIFADGDDYHSADNKAKMAAGHPLDDNDRKPWLETLNGLMLGWLQSVKGGVLACSALKESYRQILSAQMPLGSIHFVMLELSKEQLAARMKGRHHEFMNPGLLESQLATLEEPKDALAICNDRTPSEVVAEIRTRLQIAS